MSTFAEYRHFILYSYTYTRLFRLYQYHASTTTSVGARIFKAVFFEFKSTNKPCDYWVMKKK